MEGSYEYGNVMMDFIKGRDFFDQTRDCWLLKKTTLCRLYKSYSMDCTRCRVQVSGLQAPESTECDLCQEDPPTSVPGISMGLAT
jgi:hypothetical protein